MWTPRTSDSPSRRHGGADTPGWLLEELALARREAQAEADRGYAEWQKHKDADTYARFRLRQDRADAAQDDLARMWAMAKASAARRQRGP